MKIAIVHNFYRSQSPSGENAAVQLQLQVMRKRGHDVQLFSKSSDEISSGSFAKALAGVSVATGFHDDSRLLEDINNFSPDVVHIHNTFPTIGSRWLRSLGYPIVATLHNFRPICAAGTLNKGGRDCTLCPDSWSMNAVVNKCYRSSAIASAPLALATRKSGSANILCARANAVVVLSPYAREIYSKYMRLDNKLHLVPNPAPHEPIPSNGSTPAKWVYVGRLSKEKGILELVSSWPEDEQLEIFGSGDLEETLILAINDKRNIRYLGSLDSSEVQSVLVNALGLIFPSICRENAPMIYVEALSAGLPVVAYGGNSVANTVELDRTGVVFREWDELSKRLKYLSQNRHFYSERALTVATERYSTSAWAESLEDIYLEAKRNFERTGVI